MVYTFGHLPDSMPIQEQKLVWGINITTPRSNLEFLRGPIHDEIKDQLVSVHRLNHGDTTVGRKILEVSKRASGDPREVLRIVTGFSGLYYELEKQMYIGPKKESEVLAASAPNVACVGIQFVPVDLFENNPGELPGRLRQLMVRLLDAGDSVVWRFRTESDMSNPEQYTGEGYDYIGQIITTKGRDLPVTLDTELQSALATATFRPSGAEIYPGGTQQSPLYQRQFSYTHIGIYGRHIHSSI